MALYHITDGDIVEAQAVRVLPRRAVYRWILGALAIQKREEEERESRRLEEEAKQLGD